MPLTEQQQVFLECTRPGVPRPGEAARVAVLALCTVAVLAALGLLPCGGGQGHFEWSGVLATWGFAITGFVYAATPLWTAFLFSPIFAAERDAGTLEALAMAPLRGDDLLAGRMRPLWDSIRLFLFAVLPLLLLLPRDYDPPPSDALCILCSPGGPSILGAMAPLDRGPLEGSVNVLTAFAGLVAWAAAFVRAWAAAWVAVFFSLKLGTALRARLASLASALGLIVLEIGLTVGVYMMWGETPNSFYAFVVLAVGGFCELLFLAGLTVSLRRHVGSRFDLLVLGKDG